MFYVAAWLLASVILPLHLAAEVQQEPGLTFCCSTNNDLFLALVHAGYHCPRFSNAAEALRHAKPGSAVLILAENYPAQTTRLDPAEFDLAREKNLRLYLEYPAAVPGLEVGSPQTTVWERGVVASDDFGAALPRLRILAIHDCHYTPVKAAQPLLVVARVAGFDTAVYGLPTNAQPILFEIPERHLFIAATKLSGFITGRYAPAQDWQIIWQTILAKLDPSHAPHKLAYSPKVTPAFGPGEKMPRHFEKKAFDQYAAWIVNSRLLVSPARAAVVEKTLAISNGEIMATPGPDEPVGDGSHGILEGYASGIRFDGQQVQRLPLRADCNVESAMVLSFDAMLNHRPRSAIIASNLLDYVYFNSGMCGGPRADPKHGAYGLIGWGAFSPAWLVANYGDDDARAMFGAMIASVCLRDERWDEPLLKALLANLRTTGKLGFRGDRIDLPALEKGWKPFHDSATVNYSPHFESYLWACNLWAYRQTGFQPFLTKATNAIAMTMKVYPEGWRWKDNLERAHMLLCLSWLVRVQDTPGHREWLLTVANDLLRQQQPSGTIHDWLGGTGGGHLQIPQSNEAYGTTETPLIQQNGDPSSDQLYTTGFALLGLHEAVAATGDKSLKKAEDRLAEFLCRIQVRSPEIPYLNGTWFRAFDDRRWEFWASSADVGWGAWSVESGWGQAWTATVLGLRQKRTSFWDLTAHSHLKGRMATVMAQMSMREEDF